MGSRSLESFFSIKKIKSNKLSDKAYTLSKNLPRMIDQNNNDDIIQIREENENEKLFIHSKFTDESIAIIGHEYYLTNFINKPKAVDFSYYYVTVDHKATIYLYDMKKTFAGINELLDLIEQWEQSIKNAKSSFMLLKDFDIELIRIGVITEDNDVNRRKRELAKLLKNKTPSNKIPSFLQRKRAAIESAKTTTIKLLKQFDSGKLIIDGNTYKYDIREFDNQKHDMYFEDGQLKKDKAD